MRLRRLAVRILPHGTSREVNCSITNNTASNQISIKPPHTYRRHACRARALRSLSSTERSCIALASTNSSLRFMMRALLSMTSPDETSWAHHTLSNLMTHQQCRHRTCRPDDSRSYCLPQAHSASNTYVHAKRFQCCMYVCEYNNKTQERTFPKSASAVSSLLKQLSSTLLIVLAPDRNSV